MLREFESLGPVSQRGRLKRSGPLHLTRVNTGTLPSISVTNATVVGNIFNTPSPARSLGNAGTRYAHRASDRTIKVGSVHWDLHSRYGLLQVPAVCRVLLLPEYREPHFRTAKANSRPPGARLSAARG
jgi:hypothetical protein